MLTSPKTSVDGPNTCITDKGQPDMNSLDNWYPQYESQNWYPNTFLVNSPDEISRATGEDKEWNNVTDSGCHFTCIAMMLGLNPAYWAGLLRRGNVDDTSIRGRKIFAPDPDPAYNPKDLRGKQTEFVWDQNAPAYRGTRGRIRIRSLWHPIYQDHYDLSLSLHGVKYGSSVQEANDIIAQAKDKGLHVICGYSDHSRLVAGTRDGAYFLWDPDLGEKPISKKSKPRENALREILAGDRDLSSFFDEYQKDDDFKREKAEFWCYEVVWKPV